MSKLQIHTWQERRAEMIDTADAEIRAQITLHNVDEPEEFISVDIFRRTDMDRRVLVDADEHFVAVKVGLVTIWMNRGEAHRLWKTLDKALFH